MMKKITQLTMLVVAMVGLSLSSFAQATDLIISEYAEGSSFNKYIEIYNGTGAAVDLSSYEFWKNGNGGAWASGVQVAFSGIIPAGGTFIAANSQANATITALADTLDNNFVNWNGNDGVALAKDNGSGTYVIIDVIGTALADGPWDVAGTTSGTQNHTLVRNANICSPQSVWATSAGTTTTNSEWTVNAQDTWTDLGTHTSTCAPVSSDTTKPEVVNGVFTSATSVTVVFSEGVTSATAEDVSNYVLTPALTVSTAVLSASEDSVTLTIMAPGFVSGSMYNVAIANVVDTSANANMMDPFTTDFYFNDYAGTDLMITEIYHSQPSSGAIKSLDYFELYNSGTSAISLAGMEITSGVEMYIDSNISLAAGDYLVFAQNYDSFNLAFPTVMNVIEFDNGSLSGGGETITLTNTIGNDVASVSYETSAPWVAYSNTEAIELCDLTTDYTDAANWYYSGTMSSNVAATLYGTPGAMSSCATPPTIPTYDIATIRTYDADGILDSLEVYCKIKGIVHGVDLDGNDGFTFALIDATHGITVHSFNDVSNYVVTQGDELRVIGTVKQYNGLAQLRVDSIVVVSTGNCIPYATVVDTLGEMTESNYIEIKNVMLADASQWPGPGVSSNVDIVTMNGDTLVMRLDADTKIQDSILFAPSGTFSVVGTGGQFARNAPHLDGYQIFPMFVTDIDSMDYAAPAGLQINELALTNASTHADPAGGYYQWVELYNSSTSNIPLDGYFISTDSTMVFGERIKRCLFNSPVAVSIDAGDFVVGYMGTDGSLYLTTPLDENNPYVGLYTPNGTLVSGITFPSNINVEGQTYGAQNDDWSNGVVFERGTPEASNATGWVLSVLNANAVNALEAYPNPISNGNVNFNKVVSFDIYSITGQVIATRTNVTSFDVSNLESGVYLIKTTDSEIARIVVK